MDSTRIIRLDAPLGSVDSAQNRPAPLQGGRWITFNAEQDGLEARFPAGTLADFAWLTADFLLDGDELAIFILHLDESDTNTSFGYSFGLLNQCQARLRLPLSAVDLNTWMYAREAALLKPLTHGQRVDLHKVDRLRLQLLRFSGSAAQLCMTALNATVEEPPQLTDPLLPRGALLDELGQSTQREWQQKVGSAQQLIEALKQQHAQVKDQGFGESFSRWGGWAARQWQASGYFRTAFEDGRWWLVDPDGHPFWSTGLDCVATNVESAYTGLTHALTWLPQDDPAYEAAFETNHYQHHAFDYSRANMIRVFGDRWYTHWSEMTAGLLRGWGFNTVANWSNWHMASRAGLPYTRPLREEFRRSKPIYREFPDVFAAEFTQDAADYARQLEESRDDPAFIGYFLLNEPTWGFSTECLAEGMLFNSTACQSRKALAEHLRAKHGDDAALSQAWGMAVKLDALAEGAWTQRLTDAARLDLEEFSTVLVARFFGMLNAACKAVDPNHLNLGARYYTIPPLWALRGMTGFDVFSINCYRERVPAQDLAQITAALNIPVMIGEWHFGALDVGLPASGIGRTHTQADRGRAYRVYVETAAVIPSCVGVHYFTLYDQSALGRFDGENYNIGFLDVCHQPYADLARAARETHERLYQLVAGELQPYEDAPEYLPRVYL